MEFRQIVFSLVLCLFAASTASAQSTLVPGHQKADKDGNGIADAGINVNNHYSFTIAYAPDYVCTYVVNTRGDYGNTPYLDSGRIMNMIRCDIGGATYTYQYFFVHASDPHYTGEGTPIWGTWEWFNLVESHLGNTLRNGR